MARTPPLPTHPPPPTPFCTRRPPPPSHTPAPTPFAHAGNAGGEPSDGLLVAELNLFVHLQLSSERFPRSYAIVAWLQECLPPPSWPVNALPLMHHVTGSVHPEAAAPVVLKAARPFRYSVDMERGDGHRHLDAIPVQSICGRACLVCPPSDFWGARVHDPGHAVRSLLSRKRVGRDVADDGGMERGRLLLRSPCAVGEGTSFLWTS